LIYFHQNRGDLDCSLNTLYKSVGYSKQGLHQYLGRSNRYKEEVLHIIDLIRQIRDDHPTMCCRSMYYKINPSYIGRDRFEALCREYGFTMSRTKAKHNKNRRYELKEGIIFHSDGGGQYYADEFLSFTKDYKFKNSMCKHAYENGKAERINGIIKNNYLRHWNITNLSELIKGVDRAVNLYNTDKPHSSLQRMTPIQFENKLRNFNQTNVLNHKDTTIRMTI